MEHTGFRKFVAERYGDWPAPEGTHRLDVMPMLFEAFADYAEKLTPAKTIDTSNGGVVFLSVGDMVTMKSEHFTGEIIEIFYPKNLGFHYIIEDKNQIAEWNRLRIVDTTNVESYEKRT